MFQPIAQPAKRIADRLRSQIPTSISVRRTGQQISIIMEPFFAQWLASQLRDSAKAMRQKQSDLATLHGPNDLAAAQCGTEALRAELWASAIITAIETKR